MKFLLTKELGRLAKWLRILGFDAKYMRAEDSASIIVEALRDERIILTRNHRLGQRKGIKIMVLEKEKIKEQISEVLKLLRLKPEADKMFSRCTVCNEELVEIAKEKIKDKVPGYVFETQDNFVTCPRCQRIYWQGTHWGNVKELLSEIK